MGIFTVSVSVMVRARQTLTLGLEPTYHTLYLPMHIHTYTCPSNPKVGKCTRLARATLTHRAVIQTLLHAIFNSRFAPFGVVT